MQKLTIFDVLTAVGRFIKAGTLGAMQHDTGRYDYGDGCRCAIGAGLNHTSLAAIEADSLQLFPLWELEAKNIVQTEPNEYNSLVNLQRKHDDWANAKRAEGEGAYVTNCKTEFFTFYRELCEQYHVQPVTPAA